MKLRYPLIAFSLLLGSLGTTQAQISVGIGLPGVSIGINMPVYPQLVPIPGYPVYYDPYVNSNYFFYDGLYWVFQGDNWYASSWYDGPWQLTPPAYVPLFVLRIPVRYYRRPPVYFRGWRPDAPPRWGEHWGRDWERRRPGWDHWDHRAVPRAAPLPSYQSQYSGKRYPGTVERQEAIRSERYRYQPRDDLTQQHWQQRGNAGGPPAESRPPDFHLNRQRQPMQPVQPMQPQAVHPQPMQPQPMQPQPAQRPPQLQHRQFEPQERGRENRAARADGERRHGAERQDRGQDRGQGRGGRPEPQDRGR